MVPTSKKRMITTISKITYNKLEKAASAENRSVSNYVVTLIKNDLKSKETKKGE